MAGNKYVHFDNDDGGGADVNDDDGDDDDDDEGALAGQMGPGCSVRPDFLRWPPALCIPTMCTAPRW